MWPFDGLINNAVDAKMVDREKAVKAQFDEAIESAMGEIKLLSDNVDNDSILPGNWTSINSNQAQPKFNEFLKEFHEWVYANVTAIAEAVSHIELKLMRYQADKDEVTEVYEHPILELMNRPNPVMTKRDFIYNVSCLLLLAGEAPIRLRRPNNTAATPPTELWPLRPADITLEVGTDQNGFELLTDYIYRSIDAKGKQLKLTLQPWELLFIHNPNPRNHWRGVGVVEAAARTIDILDFSETWNLQFFKNSAIPAALLYTEQKMNKDTMERIKANWNAEYRGYKNTYKMAILEQGLKFQEMQSSIKDMDFIQQQTYLRDKLMAMFKTTKVVLGITDDVNRANAEASEYVFTKHTVKPKMKQLVDHLNEWLLPLFDPDGQLFFDFEDPLPEDRVSKVNEWSSLVDKVYTKNEIRRELGLADLDGGDEIWQLATLVPMNPASPLAPVAPVTPSPSNEPPEPGDQSEDGDVQEDGLRIIGGQPYRILKVKPENHLWKKKYYEPVIALRNRNIELKRARRQFRQALKQVIHKIEVKKQDAPKPAPRYKVFGTLETSQLFVHYYLMLHTATETKVLQFIRETLYKAELATIVANLQGKKHKFIVAHPFSSAQKSADAYMYNKSEYVKLSLDELTVLLKDLMLAQGGDALALLNSDKTYRLLDAARKYLKRDVVKAIKTFNDTTYKTVRDSLAEGMAAQESEPQLIKRLTSVYDDLSQTQAQMVARTEVSRAANFANVDAYTQSGVVEAKEWATVDDPCPLCEGLDGKVIALADDYFKDGDIVTGVDGSTLTLNYDDVGEPPLHVNCRCTTLPVLIASGKATPAETPDDQLTRLEQAVLALDPNDHEQRQRLMGEIEATLKGDNE